MHIFTSFPLCVERERIDTFGKPNWFGNVEAEHAAACNNVALLDLSSFAKFEVEVGVQYKMCNLCFTSQPHTITCVNQTPPTLSYDHQ